MIRECVCLCVYVCFCWFSYVHIRIFVYVSTYFWRFCERITHGVIESDNDNDNRLEALISYYKPLLLEVDATILSQLSWKRSSSTVGNKKIPFICLFIIENLVIIVEIIVYLFF